MTDDYDFEERERDRQETREQAGRDRDRELYHYTPDQAAGIRGLISRLESLSTVGEYLDAQDAVIEDDDRCVYCLHSVSRHDNAVPGCSVCGCTRVVFADE